MGRRNSRGDCARRGRGFSFIGRRAAAAQRERHSDSLSSRTLVGPQTQCKRDRAKSSRAASRVKFMAQVPIIMPQLGESIAEATIVDIKVKSGDEVAADQEILDVETNKAVMGVTTPCKGKIDKITVQLKETYPVGAVLGYVEASEADAARFNKAVPEPPKGTVSMEIPGREEQAAVAARQRDGEGV